MAGKEGSNTRRGKGRRPTGGSGTLSLGHCTTTKHHTAVASGEEGDFSLRPCATKHMAVEEAVTGEEGNFSLRPCATRHMAAATGDEVSFSLRPCATIHMAVEEAAAGDEGPLKVCPTKRKAAGYGYAKAGDCEALETLLPRESSSAIEGRAIAVESHNLLNRSQPMAVDLFPEQEMVSSADVRERVKADLRAFPESAAMDTVELDEAVDRIIMESKPETASPVAPGMRRLSDEDIAIFFSLGTEIPTIDDLAPGGVFPPGWIEERRRQLDEEVQPEKRMVVHELGVLLAKIRVDLLTKGYVDVPRLYLEDTPDLVAAYKEAVALNPPKHKDYSDVIAGPDDEEYWLY